MNALRRLLSLTLVVSLCLVTSCKKTPDNVTPTPEPSKEAVVNIKSEALEATAAGGNLELLYTITNPVEGGKVSASCDDKWVGSFDYSTDGVIRFVVAPNTSRESRETTITVAYSAAPKTATLKLTQAGSTKESFTFGEVEATHNSLSLDVRPLDMNTEYILICYTKETVEVFQLDNDAAIFEYALGTLRSEAGSMPLHNYLRQVAYMGEAAHTSNELRPDTDYVFFCFHVDLNSPQVALIDKIYSVEARTEAAPIEDIEFNVELIVDGPIITQNITPVDFDGYYTCGVWSIDDFYRYYGADADMEETFVAKWHDTVTIQNKHYGLSFAKILEQFCYTGPQTFTHNELNASTEYVFYIFAVEQEECYAASACQLFFATTEEPQTSTMTISIEAKNIQATSADVYWVASDPEGKFARSVYTMADWNAAGATDQERLDTFVAADSFYVATGQTDINLYNLTPGTEYVAFAYGVDGGAATTDLFTYQFKTKEKVVGKSVLTMTFSDYYLLSELAEYDPSQWGSYAGYDASILLPVDITVEPYAYDIYYTAYPTVADYNTDDQWLSILGSYQQYDRNHYNFYISAGTTYTLLGVAKDSDGNYGPLFKHEITATADGAGDPSSLVYESNN